VKVGGGLLRDLSRGPEFGEKGDEKRLIGSWSV
jgi:hypothetical protein